MCTRARARYCVCSVYDRQRKQGLNLWRQSLIVVGTGPDQPASQTAFIHNTILLPRYVHMLIRILCTGQKPTRRSLAMRYMQMLLIRWYDAAQRGARGMPGVIVRGLAPARSVAKHRSRGATTFASTIYSLVCKRACSLIPHSNSEHCARRAQRENGRRYV